MTSVICGKNSSIPSRVANLRTAPGMETLGPRLLPLLREVEERAGVRRRSGHRGTIHRMLDVRCWMLSLRSPDESGFDVPPLVGTITITCRFLLLLTASFSLAHGAITQPPNPALKTEHFDHDPDWEGFNNHVHPSHPRPVMQDFGYISDPSVHQ